jgi:hypothetical protein
MKDKIIIATLENIIRNSRKHQETYLAGDFIAGTDNEIIYFDEDLQQVMHVSKKYVIWWSRENDELRGDRV